MRLIWSWCVSIVATIGGFLGSAVTLPFFPSGRGGIVSGRLWARAVLWGAGVRIRIRGRESAGRGPYVVVSNHVSMLDICTCMAAVPVPCHFVSRPFFFKVPILGWGMWMARHISLDPKRPRKAARVLRGLGRRFSKGLSILLFPEGTRSEDGSIQRYKRGPFLTAIENGVDILPIHLSGLHERLPKGSLRVRPGEVRVTIGAPISTQGLDERDARRLAQQTEEWARQQTAGG